MPCYSVIQKTKMVSADHLMAAGEALELGVRRISDNQIVVGGMVFSRSRSDLPFNVEGDTDKLIAVQRKYAEQGVRAFAKSRGYTVTMEGQKMVVQNRRG